MGLYINMELHATKTLQTPSTRCWLQKYSHTLLSAAGVSASLLLTVKADRQTPTLKCHSSGSCVLPKLGMKDLILIKCFDVKEQDKASYNQTDTGIREN